MPLILAVCALAVQSFAAPLSIEQQGSFAVGGTVKTSKGIYQPQPEITKGKESNNFLDVFNASVRAGGQTLHGDHATVFYQIPTNPRPYPLVFLHGQDNPCGLGKQHRMVVKASRISFYAATSLFT